MTYPHQNDYGGANGSSANAQLVPGGLRVYRHYRLHDQGLTSTITTREPLSPGVNDAKCLATPNHKADKQCPQCKGQGRYTVAIPNPTSLTYRSFVDDTEADFHLSGLDTTTVVQRDCDCITEHPAPNLDCQCGFYASYDPRLDFFEEYIRQILAHPGSAFGADIPPVFAVVEASGRVLMGTKGVRAERMRIVAMCIDVEHAALSYRNPYLGMGQPSISRGFFSGGYIPQDQYDEMRRDVGAGLDVALQQYVNQLDYLQYPYAARSYGIDVDGMIRDHPRPDLSGLIKGASNG